MCFRISELKLSSVCDDVLVEWLTSYFKRIFEKLNKNARTLHYVEVNFRKLKIHVESNDPAILD